MAVAIPVLTDYTRPTPTTGVVHADNVPLGITCRAYSVTVTDSPPVVAEAGNAVGDGNPNLTVNLTLPGVTWEFFGISIPKPVIVFLLNNNTGSASFSSPSVKSLPQVVSLSPHAIGVKNLQRTPNDANKIEFAITGLPDNTYKMYIMWVNIAGSIVAEEVVGNGYHVLTASFDPTWPYSFLGLPQAPDGTFLDPVPVSEDIAALPVGTPTLDRVLTEDGDRRMEVYWSPSVDTRIDSYSVFYRNKSRNELNWNVLIASTSPVVITGLKRGNTYEVMLVSKDKTGKSSLPTSVMDIFVRG